MRETPPGIKFLGHQSSAGNIGTASSTRTSIRDPGRLRRTADCWSMSWNLRVRRSGRKSPSSWLAGQKTHLKTGSTFSWGHRNEPLATSLRSDLSGSASADSCLRRDSRTDWNSIPPSTPHTPLNSRRHFHLKMAVETRSCQLSATVLRCKVQWVSSCATTTLWGSSL